MSAYARPSLVRRSVYVIAFNTAIAAILTGVGYGGATFWESFVHSQSIGLLAWLICDGGRRLLWPDGAVPTLQMLGFLAAGILCGWFGGTWLAATLLGIPWTLQNYLSSLLIAAVAAFIAIQYFLDRERVARIERQVAEVQLKLLQAQIEPHFLFNTLANLRALIPSDPARALLMLDHLDGFLRAALSAARKEKNTLADEFRLLRDYLEILSIRMGPRLRFRLELAEALAGTAVPPMLVQPLVENAVRHGIEPRIEGGEIAVSATGSGRQIVIEVSDTGRGLSAPPAGGTRSGLPQLRERLAALYGSEASFELTERAGGGALARLTLPLATAA